MFRNASIITAALMAASLTTAADAAAVITISDTVGPLPGLQMTLAGSIDLTGAVPVSSALFFAAVRANEVYVSLGSTANLTTYAVTGPRAVGPGTTALLPTSTSGNAFEVLTLGNGSLVVALAADYVSGSALSATSFYSSRSTTTAGLTPGSYVYTLPSDTLTVNIVGPQAAAAVPEPATWATLVAGFALTGAAMRRRRPAMRSA